MSKKWSETLKPRVSVERLVSFKSSKLKFFFSKRILSLTSVDMHPPWATSKSQHFLAPSQFATQKKTTAIAVSRTNIKTYQPRHGGFIAFWRHPIQQTEQVGLYTWKSALFTLLVHMQEKNTKHNLQNHEWTTWPSQTNVLQTQNWCSADKGALVGCDCVAVFNLSPFPLNGKLQWAQKRKHPHHTSHLHFWGTFQLEWQGDRMRCRDAQHKASRKRGRCRKVPKTQRFALCSFALPRSSKPSSCCKAAGHWRFSACAKTTVATETAFAFTWTQCDTLTKEQICKY